MKCFFCKHEASSKIGTSKGNIFKALLGKKCWEKDEFYVCKKHYEEIRQNRVALAKIENGVITWLNGLEKEESK